MVKSFREFLESTYTELYPPRLGLEALYVTDDGEAFEILQEGKWVRGRFDKNIRIDKATHLQGAADPHAHVLGRKGNKLVIVKFDGTGSHGTKGRLHDKDADALRAHGFKISADNIVEWWVTGEIPQLLFE